MRTKDENAEVAVRRYLEYLADPESVVDIKAVAEAAERRDKAKDPLARLRAIRDLRIASAPDVDALRGEFRRVIGPWMDANGFVPADLIELGVAASDLGTGSKATGSRRSTPQGAAKTARKRRTMRDDLLSAEAVASAVVDQLRSRQDGMTVAELVEEVPTSKTTMERVFKQLVADGTAVAETRRQKVGKPARSIRLAEAPGAPPAVSAASNCR